MRRKTIGRNPLDQLERSTRKGKGKKKAVPSAPAMQSEIREALLEAPSGGAGALVGWLGSVLRRLTG